MSWTLTNGDLMYDDELVGDYDDDDNENLQLKVSPKDKYAAVCGINKHYADFYTKHTVDGYKHYLYSLKRNTYRTENNDYVLEFFRSPIDTSKTLFIFNRDHGELGVYDANSGKQLHTDEQNDKFITSIKIINDNYLYVTGWYWSPIFFTSIYKINDLLTKPDYEPIILDTGRENPVSKEHIRLNSDNMIEIFDEGHPYHKCFTLDEFYSDHEKIKNDKEGWEYTQEFTSEKDNFIRRVLKSDDPNVKFTGNSKEKLIQILQKDSAIVHGECRGNNSGMNLKSHIYALVKEIKYDDTSFMYLFPKLLFSGFCSKLHGLKEINLTFTFEKSNETVKMTVHQKMKLMADNEWFYEIDPEQSCDITFR